MSDKKHEPQLKPVDEVPVEKVPALPDVMERADLLEVQLVHERVQRLEAEVRALQLQAQQAEQERINVVVATHAKYRMTEQDSVNFKTGRITRRPHQ